MDRERLRQLVSDGFEPDYLFFWGHTVSPSGAVGKTCLSQWYPAAFTVDGVRYATSEHWMMAGKARLFGDSEQLRQIVASSKPSEAKACGRKVAGFDRDAWNAHSFEIVVQGNVHKFSQNPALLEFLLQTGDRVLVEAAPRDRIWGIGLGANNPKAQDPSQWRGRNLLGFALMAARERLLQSA